MSRALFIAVVAALIMAGVSVLVVSGSSHNDAPLIAMDPQANNTDVYAYVSPANPNAVTLIANYIPMEEPGNGPTHYLFSDDVLYEIMVDVNGDAREDLTYQFSFKTSVGVITPNTFLYNTGPIGLPPNTGDPTSQYTNLNIHQSYSLTGVVGDRRTSHDRQALLHNARVAPARVGPVSTPASDYGSLAAAAIHNFNPTSRVFVGPRDEAFYVDLMAAFDLLGGFTNPQRPAADTFSGFNVQTIALEIPKTRLAQAGDTDGIIGVWASASRKQINVLRPNGNNALHSGRWVQVSRLGNPLVNELLLPFGAKDLFNASEPKNDVANGFDNLIVNPGASQGPAALIPLINSLTSCTPTDGRIDLDLIFLKGIDAGTAGALAAAVPGLQPFADAGGNQDTQQPGGPTPADMLRLNYNVQPSAQQSRSPLGFFGGDPAGFPNGRRVGDDVVDIALKGGGGAVLHVLGFISCAASLGLSDGVQSNDMPYLTSFPYMGTPHEGYRHEHDHGGPSPLVVAGMGIGSGVLVGGLLLGGVAFMSWRRRRSPV